MDFDKILKGVSASLLVMAFQSGADAQGAADPDAPLERCAQDVIRSQAPEGSVLSIAESNGIKTYFYKHSQPDGDAGQHGFIGVKSGQSGMGTLNTWAHVFSEEAGWLHLYEADKANPNRFQTKSPAISTEESRRAQDISGQLMAGMQRCAGPGFTS